MCLIRCWLWECVSFVSSLKSLYNMQYILFVESFLIVLPFPAHCSSCQRMQCNSWQSKDVFWVWMYCEFCVAWFYYLFIYLSLNYSIAEGTNPYSHVNLPPPSQIIRHRPMSCEETLSVCVLMASVTRDIDWSHFMVQVVWDQQCYVSLSKYETGVEPEYI